MFREASFVMNNRKHALGAFYCLKIQTRQTSPPGRNFLFQKLLKSASAPDGAISYKVKSIAAMQFAFVA